MLNAYAQEMEYSMPIKGEIGQNFKPSTIETIDAAVLKFVESMNLHAQTNKGFNPVPIIWVGAERTYQIKNAIEWQRFIRGYD